MFRPIPQAAFFRKAPVWLLASIPILLGIGFVILLLLRVEALSKPDLVVLALLIVLGMAVSIAAVMSFLHYASTKRTLEEVKGLARNILQSIPTGILTINRSGVITAVNPTAEAVLKRPAADLLGTSYESVFVRGELIREVLERAWAGSRSCSSRSTIFGNIVA